MKYALLGYDLDGSLEHVAADAKRTLHGRHGELHEHASIGDSIKLIAHYRFRPSPLATIRPGSESGTGTPALSEGAASEASAT
jgi:hypothetical protein